MERLGALSSLTRSGVRPLSSSAAGLLGSPCHPGRELVWAKPEIPWFTPKKNICKYKPFSLEDMGSNLNVNNHSKT